MDAVVGGKRKTDGLVGVMVELEERFLRSAARRAKMRRGREESGCSGRNDRLWNWNDALWVLTGESGSEPKKKTAGLVAERYCCNPREKPQGSHQKEAGKRRLSLRYRN